MAENQPQRALYQEIRAETGVGLLDVRRAVYLAVEDLLFRDLILTDFQLNLLKSRAIELLRDFGGSNTDSRWLR